MTQNSKDLLKAILLAVYTFLMDLVFGYGIFFVVTSNLQFFIILLAVSIILLLLVPWNIFVWRALKETIKKHKELKNNDNITQ